jgi:hypothetical protein
MTASCWELIGILKFELASDFELRVSNFHCDSPARALSHYSRFI